MHSVYAGGDFKVVAHDKGLFAFVRENGKKKLLTATNRASFEIKISVGSKWRDAITGEVGECEIPLQSNSFKIVEIL